MSDDQERWDARWAQVREAPSPPRALTEHAALLPTAGRALEVACGLGAGALWLAERGLDTAAWDVSPVALERLQAEARRRGVDVETQARDVVAAPPPPDSADVVLVVRFLDRGLLPALRSAVRPGGLLILQTFVGPRQDRGPRRPEWRLRPGEILQIAAGFAVLVSEEGPDEEAVLIAQRPCP